MFRKIKLHTILERIPFTQSFKRRRWIKNTYTAFATAQREYVFMSIARFCHINRPMNGYYFEFGCHSGSTMRMAYDYTRHLFNWTYVAFDSFEGLPDIADIDKQEIWKKGKLKTSEEDFIKLMLHHGMPANQLITVKGFYDKILNNQLKARLLPQKAVVIYIDCDLYTSTVPILKFIKDFLKKGTVIIFDDWNCFHADPDKGERKAFREFLDENPSLIFEDFIQTNEAKAFVFLGERSLTAPA